MTILRNLPAELLGLSFLDGRQFRKENHAFLLIGVGSRSDRDTYLRSD